MFLFLLPLMTGFIINAASVFTTFYTRRFGERGGILAGIILRDVLGIPLWVLGYIMAVLEEDTTMLFNPHLITSTLGWFLILAGAVVIFTGLVALRWRAAAPTIHDTLVVHGIYAHIRHPLYSGMLLELAGLFLLLPTLPMLVACGLGVIWINLQARLEEMDLVERLPAYKEYMQQVPRFIPKIK